MQIFLDSDGVLADFDGGFLAIFGQTPKAYQDENGQAAFWNAVQNDTVDFYGQLPLMSDARELFNAVNALRPIILTGCPLGDWSQLQKLGWSGEHFKGTPMIVCMSKNKHDYCRKGDILVDDSEHNRAEWEEVGGVFVHHTSAASSIAELKHLGVL